MYRLVSILMQWDLFKNTVKDYLFDLDLVSSWSYEEDGIAAAFWMDPDGWRGWSIEDSKYYFNDIPDESFIKSSETILGMIH
jgi:hypothetical protein